MSGRATADVVVIGAGIAGASAAWALSRSCRVELLELEAQPGHHATGRSAAVISETSGPPVVCALAAASRTFLEHPPDGFVETPLLSPRGLLWVADPRRAADLDRLASVADGLGVRADHLDVDAARAMVPVLRPEWLARALHEPDARSVDVAALLSAFLDGVRRQGGNIRLAHPALTISPSGGDAPGWRVATHDVEIDCSHVVNAAGAWADEVARRAGVAPVDMAPLLRTAFVMPHDDARGWPLVMDVASRFYFEPEGPGLLVSPADETPSEPGDARADEIPIALATDALAEATTIVVRGVRQRWAGLRTFAPDRLPVVGPDPTASGFVWLAGQGGGGIKTAPALAELTAALVTGGGLPPELARHGVDPAAIAPDRFR